VQATLPIQRLDSLITVMVIVRRPAWSLFLVVCCFGLSANSAAADNIMAKTGTADDIQQAVKIARPGDTIIIPEGRFAFHGQVFLTDDLNVRGAGRDKTFIIRDDRLSDWKAMFSVNCKTGGSFGWSGITLQGAGRDLQESSASSDHIQDQGLELRGACKGFRIFGSRFTKFSLAGILFLGDDGSTHGSPTGVIFENDFIDNWSFNLGYGILVNGSALAWQEPLMLGTENAVFVEDNYFESNRCAIQSNNGARYVFRHNQILNNREDSAPIYAHGKGPYWPRGTRSFEIYENKLQNDQTRWAGIALGGGSGVIFKNELDGVSHGIVFELGAASNSTKQYIYQDQITKQSFYQDQINDTWVWDNMTNGRPINTVTLRTLGGVNATDFLQQGRDFFFQPKPNFQPFSYPHPARQFP